MYGATFFHNVWSSYEHHVHYQSDDSRAQKMVLLFSLFDMTCLVTQDNVTLSKKIVFLIKCCTIEGSQGKIAYLNVKCHFVYMMKIHKYERTISLKKYAHNVAQYGVKNNDSPISHTMIVNMGLSLFSPYHTL